MQVDDLQGTVRVRSDEELLARLRSIRKGSYGAFVLAHNNVGPMLFVHINGEFAYLHYFNDLSGQNAGYQPTGMTPPGCPKSVLFVQIDGIEGSGSAIEMPASTICSADLAYRAAAQFFHDSAKPPSINWFAL